MSSPVPAILVALAIGGCAHSPDPSAAPDPVFGLGGQAPEALRRLTEAPYAAPPQDCGTITAEISEMDRLLGPDIDAGGQGADPGIVDWIRQSVIGMVPYRSAVRFIGGARRSERLRAEAILAGFVRRGFLKGLAIQSCGSAAP